MAYEFTQKSAVQLAVFKNLYRRVICPLTPLSIISQKTPARKKILARRLTGRRPAAGNEAGRKAVKSRIGGKRGLHEKRIRVVSVFLRLWGIR
ncbi:MAG: hypothetical protein LBS21_06415 [Clostridiales bacterium]|jgi:hypothetical protein|nr:hypothetical protein [Clostridiales bacterium]